MRYLVMECRVSYAVVVDDQGHFLKVANMGYSVGQELDRVEEFRTPAIVTAQRPYRNLPRLLTVAACVCLMVLGCWQAFFATYGTVQLTINPDVLLSVNRFDYVVSAAGLNEDGRELLREVSCLGKKVEVFSDELADRAMDLGYLTQGGRIQLKVLSNHDTWRAATEDLLLQELDDHLSHAVTVTLHDDEDDDDDDIDDDDEDDDDEEDDDNDTDGTDDDDDIDDDDDNDTDEEDDAEEDDDEDDEDDDDEDDDDEDDDR